MRRLLATSVGLALAVGASACGASHHSDAAGGHQMTIAELSKRAMEASASASAAAASASAAAAASSQQAQPSPTSPQTEAPAHRPVAAVLATFRRYEDLALGGKIAASCALETPAYLASDAARGGSCVRDTTRSLAQLRTIGPLRYDGVRVTSVGSSRAQVDFTAHVGRRTFPLTAYLMLVHGAWRVSGDQSTGDLGWA